MNNKEVEEMRFYKNKVIDAKIAYFECFEAYYNYQLKLCDKYTLKELDNLGDIDYLSFERLKLLYRNMLITRSDYERALRELYNYKVLNREFKTGVAVFNDLNTDKEVNINVGMGKRQYKGVK